MPRWSASGAAWVYGPIQPRPRLPVLEPEARAARRGLWALPEAERMPPWEWRRKGRLERQGEAAPASPRRAAPG